MKANRERLAWIVLSIAFGCFVALVVALPLGIRTYVFRAEVQQDVALEVQRGPLRVTLAGRGMPVAVAENRDEIQEGTVVATDSTSGQLVMSTHQPERSAVVRIQIYDNTEVILQKARTPRFTASHLPNEVDIEVRGGRVRIGVSGDDARATLVNVHTGHGTARLTEGSYEVKVNGGRMEVTVRRGEATVSNASQQSLSLGPAERAAVEAGMLTGPLPGARNLIVNGDFQSALQSAWDVYDTQTDPQQPPARATIADENGRDVVDFFRAASNHAEVGVTQDINYDVRDFTFLELHMAIRIDSQDIAGFGGCGYLSSECPIIVVIEYEDTQGTDREWRHGFYTGNPAEGWLLYPWTESVPAGTWHTYDSGNLMDELSDTPPAEVNRLRVYASGHSFHAFVTEVELLARE